MYISHEGMLGAGLNPQGTPFDMQNMMQGGGGMRTSG
jgi:hypothetical protein